MAWFKRRRRPHKEPRRIALADWRHSFDNGWIAEEYFKAVDKEQLKTRAVGGGCNRCGLERERFVLWFVEGHGTSPLCQVCWDELATPDARMPWFRAVWLNWEMNRLYRGCPYGSHSYGHPPFQIGHDHPEWETIQAAVEGAV